MELKQNLQEPSETTDTLTELSILPLYLRHPRILLLIFRQINVIQIDASWAFIPLSKQTQSYFSHSDVSG